MEDQELLDTIQTMLDEQFNRISRHLDTLFDKQIQLFQSELGKDSERFGNLSQQLKQGV